MQINNRYFSKQNGKRPQPNRAIVVCERKEKNGLGNWEWLWSVVEKVMGNVLGYGKLLCKLIN